MVLDFYQFCVFLADHNKSTVFRCSCFSFFDTFSNSVDNPLPEISQRHFREYQPEDLEVPL